MEVLMNGCDCPNKSCTHVFQWKSWKISKKQGMMFALIAYCEKKCNRCMHRCFLCNNNTDCIFRSEKDYIDHMIGQHSFRILSQQGNGSQYRFSCNTCTQQPPFESLHDFCHHYLSEHISSDQNGFLTIESSTNEQKNDHLEDEDEDDDIGGGDHIGDESIVDRHEVSHEDFISPKKRPRNPPQPRGDSHFQGINNHHNNENKSKRRRTERAVGSQGFARMTQEQEFSCESEEEEDENRMLDESHRDQFQSENVEPVIDESFVFLCDREDNLSFFKNVLSKKIFFNNYIAKDLSFIEREVKKTKFQRSSMEETCGMFTHEGIRYQNGIPEFAIIPNGVISDRNPPERFTWYGVNLPVVRKSPWNVVPSSTPTNIVVVRWMEHSVKYNIGGSQYEEMWDILSQGNGISPRNVLPTTNGDLEKLYDGLELVQPSRFIGMNHYSEWMEFFPGSHYPNYESDGSKFPSHHQKIPLYSIGNFFCDIFSTSTLRLYLRFCPSVERVHRDFCSSQLYQEFWTKSKARNAIPLSIIGWEDDLNKLRFSHQSLQNCLKKCLQYDRKRSRSRDNIFQSSILCDCFHCRKVYTEWNFLDFEKYENGFIIRDESIQKYVHVLPFSLYVWDMVEKAKQFSHKKFASNHISLKYDARKSDSLNENFDFNTRRVNLTEILTERTNLLAENPSFNRMKTDFESSNGFKLRGHETQKKKKVHEFQLPENSFWKRYSKYGDDFWNRICSCHSHSNLKNLFLFHCQLAFDYALGYSEEQQQRGILSIQRKIIERLNITNKSLPNGLEKLSKVELNGDFTSVSDFSKMKTLVYITPFIFDVPGINDDVRTSILCHSASIALSLQHYSSQNTELHAIRYLEKTMEFMLQVFDPEDFKCKPSGLNSLEILKVEVPVIGNVELVETGQFEIINKDIKKISKPTGNYSLQNIIRKLNIQRRIRKKYPNLKNGKGKEQVRTIGSVEYEPTNVNSIGNIKGVKYYSFDGQKLKPGCFIKFYDSGSSTQKFGKIISIKLVRESFGNPKIKMDISIIRTNSSSNTIFVENVSELRCVVSLKEEENQEMETIGADLVISELFVFKYRSKLYLNLLYNPIF